MQTVGILYVVATPIGNLGDITLRAIETLRLVDRIAAEDTRHTVGLLKHLGINKKMIAVHEHNERKSVDILLGYLQQGENVALVTDAGTPGISDPGAVLIGQLRQHGIRIVPIPGPSALIAALSVSGISETKFMFVGFLPATTAQRKQALEKIKDYPCVMVFYESPHRIVATVKAMEAILGDDRQVTLARELTKTFETVHQCRLKDIEDWLIADTNRQRGEFVIIVEPNLKMVRDTINDEVIRTLNLLLDELPVKSAVKLASELTGVKKNELYAYALSLKQNE